MKHCLKNPNAGGTTINNGSKVINSRVYGDRPFYAGGIAGCAYQVNIDGCIVTLSELKSGGYKYYVGGIAGWTNTDSEDSSVTNTIQNCKVNITKMLQSTETANVRGWVAGKCEGNGITIKACGVRGSYGNPATITLNNESSDVTNYFGNNIYGSSSTNVTLGSDQNACYYWNGMQ